MRNGPFLGFVGYSGAHVNFEGKAEAAWSFFLRKTKSELPVSGWSTDCGEREGERERGGKGVHIPALAVQPTPGCFAGLHSRTWGLILSPFT